LSRSSRQANSPYPTNNFIGIISASRPAERRGCQIEAGNEPPPRPFSAAFWRQGTGMTGSNPDRPILVVECLQLYGQPHCLPFYRGKSARTPLHHGICVDVNIHTAEPVAACFGRIKIFFGSAYSFSLAGCTEPGRVCLSRIGGGSLGSQPSVELSGLPLENLCSHFRRSGPFLHPSERISFSLRKP